jgi:hypothetical protein
VRPTDPVTIVEDDWRDGCTHPIALVYNRSDAERIVRARARAIAHAAWRRRVYRREAATTIDTEA